MNASGDDLDTKNVETSDVDLVIRLKIGANLSKSFVFEFIKTHEYTK